MNLDESYKDYSIENYKGGGSFFGKVGSFEKGYDFDAIVIDDSSLSDIKELSIDERIQRYVYIGDDRNIIARYVQGKKIEEPFLKRIL